MYVWNEQEKMTQCKNMYYIGVRYGLDVHIYTNRHRTIGMVWFSLWISVHTMRHTLKTVIICLA